MTPSQQEALARYRSAMKRVERAQNELNEACSELSSVIGLVREWQALGKLADRVKAFWHRLNQLQPRKPWDLDAMAKQALWRRAAEARKEGP